MGSSRWQRCWRRRAWRRTCASLCCTRWPWPTPTRSQALAETPHGKAQLRAVSRACGMLAGWLSRLRRTAVQEQASQLRAKDSLAGHAMAGQTRGVGLLRAHRLRQVSRTEALLCLQALRRTGTALRALAGLGLPIQEPSETPAGRLGAMRRPSRMTLERASCMRLARLQAVARAVAEAAPTLSLVRQPMAACSARRRGERPWRSTWSPSAGALKRGLVLA